MIWAKTDAGRIEMQTRALVKDRATRNLLLVIDGSKSEEMLLANVTGISRDTFGVLLGLGLIEARSAMATSGGVSITPTVSRPAVPPLSVPAAPLDYAQFTETLTQLISKELGLRGFMLTLAVEKAGTPQELQDVARRTLAQIGERKGDTAMTAARRALYGD